MNTIRKLTAALLAVLLILSLAACGKKLDPPNAQTAAYDDMVAYLKQEGYIKDDASPVDINTTEGYITDNTGGDFPTAVLADKANDYGGLWLFWWDQENQTENYEVFSNMKINGGVMLINGGAAMMETAGQNGAYAIAFAEDYEKTDAALEAFKALPNK